MTGSTNNLRSTSDILNAIITALQAVKLDDAGDAPAFERVEMFDLSDFSDAMRRLAMNQQRTALVIWTGDEYETNREISVITTRRISTFDIFVTERRLDAPIAALTGDEASPGVLALRDKVAAALFGVVLDDGEGETVYMAPQGIERGIVSADDKKENPGRQILIMNLQAFGEWIQTAVGSNDTY